MCAKKIYIFVQTDYWSEINDTFGLTPLKIIFPKTIKFSSQLENLKNFSECKNVKA